MDFARGSANKQKESILVIHFFIVQDRVEARSGEMTLIGS